MLFVLLPRWKSVLQVLGSLDVMLQADFFDPFCVSLESCRFSDSLIGVILVDIEMWLLVVCA